MDALQPEGSADIRAHIHAIALRAFDALQQFYKLRVNRRNAELIGGVLLLHLAFVLMIVWSLRTPVSRPAQKELELALAPNAMAPPLVSPQVALPDMPVDAPPDIVIEADTPNTAPASVSSTIVLPPRPDPAHPNPPLAITGATAGLTVILKVFVQPDGSISEADTLRSSGQPGIDHAAIQFVVQNWRLQPATLGASAIEFWTTVRVPIASS